MTSTQYIPDYEQYDYESDMRLKRIQTQAERSILEKWLSPSDYCLELGGGYGRLTEVLEPYFKNVFMIDYSMRNLNKASSRLKKAILIRSDIRRLPFEDNTFDYVTAIRVLHHIEEVEVVLDEIARVARNGSTVILGISYPHKGLGRALRGQERVIKGPEQCQYYVRSPDIYSHKDFTLVDRRASGLFDNSLGVRLNRFVSLSRIDVATSRMSFLPRGLKKELLIQIRVTKNGGENSRQPQILCPCGGIIIEGRCNSCQTSYGRIIDLVSKTNLKDADRVS